MWKTNPILILVFVAFALALVVALWSILKKSFAYISNTVRGLGSSLTSDEAKAIASSIYAEVNAMQTDEDKIVEYLLPLSLPDYYKVQAAFGIVPYNSTFDEFSELGGDDSNLTEVLNKTLYESQKEEIREKNPFLPIH